MKTITVTASKEYNIYIDSGLLGQIGTYIKGISATSRVAIISDENVWGLYGNTVSQSLNAQNFDYISYIFPAGERSKNSETYINILNFLAENKITRSDVIVALGGGVVGDITGFCAATYLRGIRYVQVPTSLLAMVDSSVGGKTAIDLPAGKNLVGAFYQPSFVLCDIDLLNTLPIELFRDGCAEIIKYGVLQDKELYAHLTANLLDFDREYVISRCVEIKRDVVCADEFDTGERQKLNLGHTIGHGIEKLSNFAISHGRAVAAGMAIISKIADALGYCEQATTLSICNVLTNFGLPTGTDETAHELFHCMLSDKKRSGNHVNLIIPRSIGNCDIIRVPIEQMETYIEKGLSWISPSTLEN